MLAAVEGGCASSLPRSPDESRGGEVWRSKKKRLKRRGALLLIPGESQCHCAVWGRPISSGVHQGPPCARVMKRPPVHRAPKNKKPRGYRGFLVHLGAGKGI